MNNQNILFHDNNLAVLVKPVGLDSEKELPQLIQEELKSEVFTLHRLDKNVGGVMVYALNKKTAAIMSKAIQEGSMVKEYLAMVHGKPEENGILEDFLFKDSRKNKVFVVKKERKGVKKAKLEYEVLKSDENKSLLHIRLHTGRSHQIRVQFSSRGFPLVGDHKYGSRDEKTEPMLWSYRISFPYKGNTMSFEKEPDWG